MNQVAQDQPYIVGLSKLRKAIAEHRWSLDCLFLYSLLVISVLKFAGANERALLDLLKMLFYSLLVWERGWMMMAGLETYVRYLYLDLGRNAKLVQLQRVAILCCRY